MNRSTMKRAAAGLGTALVALGASCFAAAPSYAYTHTKGCNSQPANQRCLDNGSPPYTIYNPWTSLLFTTYGPYSSQITTCAKAVTEANNVRNPQYCSNAMSAGGSIAAYPLSRGYGYWNGVSGVKQVNGIYTT